MAWGISPVQGKSGVDDYSFGLGLFLDRGYGGLWGVWDVAGMECSPGRSEKKIPRTGVRGIELEDEEQ
jgi:hypothetical protein